MGWGKMTLLSRILRRVNYILAICAYKMKFGNRLMLNMNELPRLSKDVEIRIIGDSIIKLGKIGAEKNVRFSSVDGGNLSIGNGSSFNTNTLVICYKRIQIGNNCLFGPNVLIYDHDHIFNEKGIQPGFRFGDVVIEDDCWIGGGTIILRGTHIGAHSVIGAGVVLSGYIPPHSLVKQDRSINITKLVENYDR